jgi:hypothetical protein
MEITSTSMDSQHTGLVKILTILFQKSLCREFRLPVEVLYPDLFELYNKVVKHPVDLGSLLLKCMRNQLTVNQAREELKLVFKNAILFNQEYVDMVAISKHVDNFSSALFEEIIKLPYNNAGLAMEKFYLKRLLKRELRYEMIRDIPLKLSEIKNVADALRSMKSITPNNLLLPLEECLNKCSKSVISNGENSYMLSTLFDVLKPLLLTCRGDINHTTTSLCESAVRADLPAICNYFHDFLTDSMMVSAYPYVRNNFKLKNLPRPHDNLLKFLSSLDEVLGVLIVGICERMTRGCNLSSIWAHPISCVWVQSVNSSWYNLL